MANQTFEKHETGLIQRLGLGTAFLLVVSSMVGSGVFKKVAPMASDTGSALLILGCWVLAGLVSWFGALSNAEVASQIPEPGGQYVYFKRIFGRHVAFLYGWTGFSVVQSATAASVAYVFAQSVHTLGWLPEITSGIGNLSVKLLAVGLIGLLTGINLLGVQQGERVSNVLTSIVLVSIVLITVLCFGSGKGNWSNFSEGGSGEVGFKVIFLGMMSAFWAYEGWNNLGFLAGEIRNPGRNVPLALAIGVGIVMGLYGAINMAYLYVLPVSDLAAISKEENTIAAVRVIQAFMGPAGSGLILGIIMVATIGSTNNTLMSASRMYFAMARDGLFFAPAAYCHPRFSVPSWSLVFQAGWASVLIFTGSFDQLTDMLIFAAFIFYGMGALSLFVLRRRNPEGKRGFSVPGYPFVPGLFLLFSIGLVVNSILEKPQESLYGLGLMALGIPFYLYWNRKSPSNSLDQI
jgi:basic amino acid/polyamine antiporter, APA family